jgi:DNA replication protein DnaC
LEYKLDEARFTDDDVSFENFDLSHFSDKPILNGPSQRELMAQYKRITQAWADKFPDCSQMVLISGGTGLGKTYTVRCIMRRVIERGFSAAYFTAYRLFSLFHSHRLGESVDLEPIFAVPLLIIDDLGTEPMTRNVTKEYLFDLINERAAANLHTIIVTNLTFDSVNERYGERIHSRLMYARHTKIIQYQGDDIRLSKQ